MTRSSYSLCRGELISDLASEILNGVRRFAAERDLGELHDGNLAQMSINLREVSVELLGFGCDAWPDSVQLPISGLFVKGFEQNAHVVLADQNASYRYGQIA